MIGAHLARWIARTWTPGLPHCEEAWLHREAMCPIGSPGQQCLPSWCPAHCGTQTSHLFSVSRCPLQMGALPLSPGLICSTAKYLEQFSRIPKDFVCISIRVLRNTAEPTSVLVPCPELQAPKGKSSASLSLHAGHQIRCLAHERCSMYIC